MEKRTKYSGPFDLGRDTTAKEMLHCFALAYFAVTPENTRTVDGLIDALCENDYGKYEQHMEYPLLASSSEMKGSERAVLVGLYDDKTPAQKQFDKEIEEARKALKTIASKVKERKISSNKGPTAKTIETAREKIKILSKENKKKRITELTKEYEKSFKKFSRIASNSLRQKLYKFTSEDSAAKSWVNSAYWTAEVLGPGKKNIIGNYSEYVYAHSTSQTSRFIKEKPLSLVAAFTKQLLVIAELKPDMYNPADIYIIKSNSIRDIANDYKEVIQEIFTGDTINHTPFLNLITTHIRQKVCVPISLKKSLTANPPAYLTGTKYKLNEHHLPLVDSYTYIIEYLSTDLANLQDKINKLVKINKVLYKHNIETFAVHFTFNYSDISKEIPELTGKQIILSDEHYNLVTASMTWNALPTDASGKVIGAYTGGAGFSQVSAILKKYPTTRRVFNNIIKLRKQAYTLAVAEYVPDFSANNLPRILSKESILNEGVHRKQIFDSIKILLRNHPSYSEMFAKNVYALYLVTLNSLLIYGRQDRNEMDKIRESLNQFAITIKNEKIKSLLPGNVLREYGWGGATASKLKPLKTQTAEQKEVLRNYSKIAYQEDRCAKLEAVFFYTEGKGSMVGDEYEVSLDVLNKIFKKQITLTIYGLITKKGAKIFLTAPELKKEKQTNQNIRQVSDALGFRTTPYFLVGNSGDDDD